jgi:hypothetical protein
LEPTEQARAPCRERQAVLQNHRADLPFIMIRNATSKPRTCTGTPTSLA